MSLSARVARNAPALTLYFLSPMVGELLSGSAPPREFFSPFGLIVIVGLYGSGALLVREAARRWGKGYPTVLCLGAAYGIFEEGIVCKSFFNPEWPDLGVLGVYGRAWETNWVWAIWLTLYHMTVSIAIPILLVEVLFPARRTQPWLNRRWSIVLGTFLVLIALLGYFTLTPYRPPWPHAVLTLTVMFGLSWLALRLPVRIGTVPVWSGPVRGRRLWGAGFSWIFCSFLVFFLLPQSSLPPLGTIIIGLAVAGGAGWLVIRCSGNLAGWDDRGRFAFAAGVLSFFALVAPLQELDPKRTDTPGMALVGLITLLFLLWEYRKVRLRIPETK